MKIRVHNEIISDGYLYPGTGYIEEPYAAIDLPDGRIVVVTVDGIAIFPSAEDGVTVEPKSVFTFNDAAEPRE